ncbi:hypothetical protein ACWNT8_15440 (plasmid) [Pigmentibacter ruber]
MSDVKADSIILSVQKSINERFSDPILSSFILFFITWNWRFFFMLFFSKGEASVRLKTAYADYLSTMFPFDCYVIPIILTATYIYGWSWLKEFLLKYRDNLIKNAENKANNKILLTKYESEKINRKINSLESVIKNDFHFSSGCEKNDLEIKYARGFTSSMNLFFGFYDNKKKSNISFNDNTVGYYSQDSNNDYASFYFIVMSFDGFALVINSKDGIISLNKEFFEFIKKLKKSQLPTYQNLTIEDGKEKVIFRLKD